MNGGYFKIFRSIFSNSIFKRPLEFRLFTYILANAVFSEEGINMGSVHVNRGQYLRSYRNLIEDLEYIENNKIICPSKGAIERALTKFEREGMIAKTETALGTLFTVCNYEQYQGNSDKNKTIIESEESQSNKLGTALGTSLGQERDSIGTIINKDKKDNKVREKNNVSHSLEFSSKHNEEDLNEAVDKIKELWLNTWGRYPKPPEVKETSRMIEKLGFERVNTLMYDSSLKNFRNFSNFLDAIDEDGNLKSFDEAKGNEELLTYEEMLKLTQNKTGNGRAGNWEDFETVKVGDKTYWKLKEAV
jgi:hypothetical protein